MIFEYNSLKKELCSVYYEPHGYLYTTHRTTKVRDWLERTTSEFFKPDTFIKIPFDYSASPSGLQVQLKNDIGFCVAVSNIWLYVVLNLIYSKSFNANVKKIIAPEKRIVMNKKLLLGNREAYLERVKIQRAEFLDSHFNQISMTGWIRYVEDEIKRYESRNENLLYNFIYMLIQYIITTNTVNIPVNLMDEYINIYEKALKLATENNGKMMKLLNNIDSKHNFQFMVNAVFMKIVNDKNYIYPILLGDENDECKEDNDCEGNLECINNVCIDCFNDESKCTQKD